MERLSIDRGHPAELLVPKLLQAVRQHLRMEVAFLAEFVGAERVFRYVDADGPDPPIRSGDGGPLAESYCHKVVAGELPALIPDAFELPLAAAMPVTRALPVRAHISVPVRLSDGRVYGTFCAFSSRPDPALGTQDLALFRVIADLVGKTLDHSLGTERDRAAAAARIQAVLQGDSITSVYQPIVSLVTGRIVGYEALSRFSAEPARPPDQWFAEAKAAGLGVDLELCAAGRALQGLARLPAGVAVNINVSSDALLDPRLPALLARLGAQRVVLEITEHDVVTEYGTLAAGLAPLRKMGARLAVDDAGAGYASFRHILRLRPDCIKLDRDIVAGIDRDGGQQALAAALAAFAGQTGASLCAEGIETPQELRALQRLGIGAGQGYLFGRPGPLPEPGSAASIDLGAWADACAMPAEVPGERANACAMSAAVPGEPANDAPPMARRRRRRRV